MREGSGSGVKWFWCQRWKMGDLRIAKSQQLPTTQVMQVHKTNKTQRAGRNTTTACMHDLKYVKSGCM